MSKKNFESAAAAIRNLLASGVNSPAGQADARARAEGAAAVIIHISTEVNPHFDSRRFLAACGL